MKIMGVSTLIVLGVSSCAVPCVERQGCQSGRVCISMEQAGKDISIQITNSTSEMVVLPEFTGLGSMVGTHLVKIESEKEGVGGPARIGGTPISSETSDVVLRPQGWIGFSVSSQDVRSLYRLPSGCQKLSVSYQLNKKEGDYYRGEVSGMKAQVCL